MQEQLNKKNVFEVDICNQGLRLDLFLTRVLQGHSRSRIQKYIDEGLVLKNGAVVSKNDRVTRGDTIEVGMPGRLLAPTYLEPQNIAIDIIYEDEYYVAINKSAGLVVHPGNGVRDRTVVNALLYSIGTLSEGSAADRPGIVHRLDKDTSGVLIAAKTNAAHVALASAFASRTVEKHYIGICIGMPGKSHDTLDMPLERNRREPLKRAISKTGKQARTEYWMLHHRAGLSVMHFKPYTGRTHQIRVHSSAMGIPIVADSLYGGGRERLLRINPADRPFAYSVLKAFNRHALHARLLVFTHPFSGNEVRIAAPLPEDFTEALRLFRDRELSEKISLLK